MLPAEFIGVCDAHHGAATRRTSAMLDKPNPRFSDGYTWECFRLACGNPPKDPRVAPVSVPGLFFFEGLSGGCVDAQPFIGLGFLHRAVINRYTRVTDH